MAYPSILSRDSLQYLCACDSLIIWYNIRRDLSPGILRHKRRFTAIISKRAYLGACMYLSPYKHYLAGQLANKSHAICHPEEWHLSHRLCKAVSVFFSGAQFLCHSRRRRLKSPLMRNYPWSNNPICITGAAYRENGLLRHDEALVVR